MALAEQSDYCRAAHDGVGDPFEPRHAMVAGAALTVPTFVGLAVAIFYRRTLGIPTSR